MVSIITVNYNGLADTCEMIESFRKYEIYPYEIIVVDNDSKQAEAALIQNRYPEVKVVQNINNGFAGGNNAGLSIATGNHLLFLNNDTLIQSPVLEALTNRLKEKKVGAVSPMIKYSYAPNTIQYAGYTNFSTISLRNNMIGGREKDNGQYSVAKQTASVHGAAMMIRRDILEQIGPMTEKYFLFYEEFDWSVRMAHAGYELWYEPSAIVYHKESMTAKRGTPLREFYLSRARLLFARRNVLGLKKILSCLYICFVAAPKKSFVYLLHGQIKLSMAVVRGTINGLFMNCK